MDLVSDSDAEAGRDGTGEEEDGRIAQIVAGSFDVHTSPSPSFLKQD